MSERVSYHLNGEAVTADVPSKWSLVRHLRDDRRLTGAKIGCTPGDGDCGTCTVLVDGRPQRACLMEMAQVEGKRVETVEGLARNGTLHPVQGAFVRTGAVQCGFCSPGFIMAAKALLDANPGPTTEEIREALSGVLCRCTGYVKVVQAVEDAAAFLAEGKWPPVRTQVAQETEGVIGVAVSPKDGSPKVTGEARFADDIYLDGMIHCKLLFSEHPHAEILSIDTAEAEKDPGVLLVLAAKDLPGTNLTGVKVKDKPIFADDRVRARTDVVAAVYAETEEAGREAVKKIRVAYRELPAVFDGAEALKEGAPLVHPENETGNILAQVEVKRGDGVFFTGMTIHGSYANHSATQDRLAFAVHYVRDDTWVLRADVQDTVAVDEHALKANNVDVNALEEKPHQPGHSLAGIKLPFDAEGNRAN